MSKDGVQEAKAASPARPGYLTTEFWTTVSVQVVSAIVALAATFGHHIDAGNLQPLIPVAALVAAGIAQAYYNHSRSNVKVAALENGGAVPVAPTVYNVTVPPQNVTPAANPTITTTPLAGYGRPTSGS